MERYINSIITEYMVNGMIIDPLNFLNFCFVLFQFVTTFHTYKQICIRETLLMSYLRIVENNVSGDKTETPQKAIYVQVILGIKLKIQKVQSDPSSDQKNENDSEGLLNPYIIIRKRTKGFRRFIKCVRKS